MNDRMTALINRVSRRVPVCCCDGAGFWALDVSTHHILFGEAIPCVCQRDSMATLFELSNNKTRRFDALPAAADAAIDDYGVQT